jgi:GAF domain-containing protein
VLSLSRVLGGSLRRQQTTNLVDDETLGEIVRESLEPISISASRVPELSVACKDESEEPPAANGFFGLPRLTPSSAMQFVVERASALTRADGAALALWQGNRMVCQANAGTAVPDIGSEVQTSGGMAGLALRTARAWRCNDSDTDHTVNVEACRDLGIRSVIAAPLNHLNRVLGILQVLSSQPFAFDDRDVATVQLLSQLMVMAFARRSDPGEAPLDSRMRLAFAGAALQ